MHTCFGEIDFQDSRKTQVLNYLGRIYYATKLTRRKISKYKKILTFSGMSDHPSIDCCNLNVTTRGSGIMTISYRKPNQTLIDLGSHSPRQSFIPCNISFWNLILARLTFFGARYVLTYSPNHSSARDVKYLDHPKMR